MRPADPPAIYRSFREENRLFNVDDAGGAGCSFVFGNRVI